MINISRFFKIFKYQLNIIFLVLQLKILRAFLELEERIQNSRFVLKGKSVVILQFLSNFGPFYLCDGELLIKP